MRARTLDLLQAAARDGYAVPAVNVVDQFSLQGVVDAAEKHRAPVILQTSVKTVRVLGAGPLAAMVEDAAQRATVPVALHLDHCPDRSVITEVLAHGWDSVLFDASDRDLATARDEAEEVVAAAHAVGASVELEVENISGVEDDIGSELEGDHYPVGVLADLVRTTGCDIFAPALGTAHGLYSARPVLRPDRAAELVQALGVPVVLHGGTGLTDEEFGAFIAAGVSKINISTSLKMAYLQGLHAALGQAHETGRWDPPTVFAAGTAAVADDVAHYVRVFGAEGRA